MARRLLVGSLILLFAAAAPGAISAQGSIPGKAAAGNAKDDGSSEKPRRAAGRKTDAPTGPVGYASKNFLVHTDLPPDEAKDLLNRLETMLAIISRYWGRPLTQKIECFVVRDINAWPDGALDPQGVAMIRGGGGITLGSVTTIGGRPVSARAPVYATADRGTPQHEAVHAYCILTFGTSGPVWYSEGMAEMGQYWKEGDKAVACHEIVSDYLRKSTPKSLNEIVNGNERTGDSWQNYAWRWALCHLLATNPNYSARFRPLGLDLLQKKSTSFEEVYGAMADEISFEYQFFLNHIEPGLRLDLCAWDWKAKYKLPSGPSPTSATIDAARGWQPSRALLKKGKEYLYSATGTWKLSKDGPQLDADGDAQGNGRLVGVLFDDYKLSEPFDLGVHGAFESPGDGQLLVRCGQNWTNLAASSGKVSLRILSADSGRTLPNPRDATATPARTAE